MKPTTHIRVTIKVKKRLDNLKIHPREPYTEVLERMLKELKKK